MSEVKPVGYGIRRKGETAIIGHVPEKVHATPARSEEYNEKYEEVPLVLLSDHTAALAAANARADHAEMVIDLLRTGGYVKQVPLDKAREIADAALAAKGGET